MTLIEKVRKIINDDNLEEGMDKKSVVLVVTKTSNSTHESFCADNIEDGYTRLGLIEMAIIDLKKERKAILKAAKNQSLEKENVDYDDFDFIDDSKTELIKELIREVIIECLKNEDIESVKEIRNVMTGFLEGKSAHDTKDSFITVIKKAIIKNKDFIDPELLEKCKKLFKISVEENEEISTEDLLKKLRFED
jgi:hypothetical protein